MRTNNYFNCFFGIFVSKQLEEKVEDYLVDIFQTEEEAALRADELESLLRPGEIKTLYLAECFIKSEEAMDYVYESLERLTNSKPELDLTEWFNRTDVNIMVTQLHEE